jgi:hypothetical protein
VGHRCHSTISIPDAARGVDVAEFGQGASPGLLPGIAVLREFARAALEMELEFVVDLTRDTRAPRRFSGNIDRFGAFVNGRPNTVRSLG